MKVKIVNTSGKKNPEYKTSGSSCMDLMAYTATIDTESLYNAEVTTDPFTKNKIVVIYPGGRALIPTGIRVQTEPGYEAQVRPRSGLALKNGITVLNTPGTIDSDYTGEIKIILANLGLRPFSVYDGDRIAQLGFYKVEKVELETVEELSDTERGDGGFGHTGVS